MERQDAKHVATGGQPARRHPPAIARSPSSPVLMQPVSVAVAAPTGSHLPRVGAAVADFRVRDAFGRRRASLTKKADQPPCKPPNP